MRYAIESEVGTTPSPVIQPTVQLEIITGDRALSLIENSHFLHKWETLYKICNWSTVFQSKEFVSCWYSTFINDFVPIIVKAESKDGLEGLLTLTKNKKGHIIMAAGLGGAEYQTWIATPAYGEIFIQKALIELETQFKGLEINLYNIPPGTPIAWAYEDRYWQKRCLIKSLRRPLMDLRDPDVYKIFRKKQFREKLNRLRRKGELKFEKITVTEVLASILDKITDQSDFRKGVRYNNIEYRNDPNRKKFILAMHDSGILHVTTLTLNNQIIALIAAATGKDWVHLAGINTHSPIFSKYSPGLINFIMLGQLLIEEGKHIFDLTPGGDAYKERLATSHDHVHDLYISSKIKTFIHGKILSSLKNIIRKELLRKGITPVALKQEASQIMSRLALANQKRDIQIFSWRYLMSGKLSTLMFHKKVSTTAYLTMKQSIKINDIGDLLDYNQKNGLRTTWDFLREAMERFENGQNAYTLAEDGELLFCVWHSSELHDKKSNFCFPQKALVLQFVHYNTNAQNRFNEFLHSVVSMLLQAQKEIIDLICLIDKKDKELYKALEQINFNIVNKNDTIY